MEVINIIKYTKELQNLADNFDCGNKVINRFLKQDYAFDNNQGVTYVMVNKDKSRIIGFYAIEADRIDEIEYIGDFKNFKFMGGAIHINFLALDLKYQKHQIGKLNNRNLYLSDYLLIDCKNRIAKLQSEVGIAFITLSSTEQGYNLYLRNSYENFEDDMHIIPKDKDLDGYKMYKCIDDIE